MNSVNNEKDMRKIEELTATNRLLTDLTEAGSWMINFTPDGSVASVQWGDGFRRLMGYTDLHDFPNELESFLRGIHPEDRDIFTRGLTARIFDEDTMRTAGYEFRDAGSEHPGVGFGEAFLPHKFQHEEPVFRVFPPVPLQQR